MDTSDLWPSVAPTVNWTEKGPPAARAPPSAAVPPLTRAGENPSPDAPRPPGGAAYAAADPLPAVDVADPTAHPEVDLADPTAHPEVDLADPAAHHEREALPAP